MFNSFPLNFQRTSWYATNLWSLPISFFFLRVTLWTQKSLYIWCISIHFNYHSLMVKPTTFDSCSIFTSPQKSLVPCFQAHVLCLNQATLICFWGKQLVKIAISLTCEFSTTLLAHQCLQETFLFPLQFF